MCSPSSSTALSSPSTRLVYAAARFRGRTGGLAAGLVLDPCLALLSRCWQVLKEPVTGLFTIPLQKAISKCRIHMPCSAMKRHGEGHILKACSTSLYVLLKALITIWKKNCTKTISTQTFGRCSETDQLLSQFNMFLFFNCDPHVITVHLPIPAHVF